MVKREAETVEYLGCPECDHDEWISPEDPDCSFSLLLNHIRSRHPAVDQTPAVLWPRLREVPS